MKNHPKIKLLVLFICVSFYTSQAQDAGHKQLTLSVVRVVDYQTRELHFKPDKKLKVFTKNGETVVTSDYSFLSDAIVVNGESTRVTERNARNPKFEKTAFTDTISLSEIDWIKGSVFDNDKVAAGIVVLLAGTAALFIPVGGVIVAGAAAAVLIIPIVPVIAAGIKMIKGTRKFKTSKGWQVKLE